MSDKFFLDTNIFVSSFDRSAARKSAKAKQLIRHALVSQKGVTSYQVVQEFFNVARRRFVQPMSMAEAGQYLGTVFQPLLAVHSSLALYSEALRIHAKRGLSWYDSLVVSAAANANCDVLYSEDLQHGQNFGRLRVANPFV